MEGQKQAVEIAFGKCVLSERSPDVDLGSISTVSVSSASTWHSFPGNQQMLLMVSSSCTHPAFDSEVHLPVHKALHDLLHAIVADSADSALFPLPSALVSCSLDRKHSFSTRSYKGALFSPRQFGIPYFRCILPRLVIGRLLKKEDKGFE